MPGGDRTGPAGMGPMTGGGVGYCVGYATAGYTNPAHGRGWRFGRGAGWRHGWGRGGFGRGRGFGWRWAADSYGYGHPYDLHGFQLAPREELEMLKAQAKAAQEEANAIGNRVAELESAINADTEKK